MAISIVLTLIAVLSSRTEGALDERGENEKRLVYDLFDKNGYNPLIRPVVNTNDSLSIRFNLALSQIINVDEVNQVMKTNVWLQIYWKDYQLGWDPSKYGNIDSIRIRPEKVWVPDLVLFNNADGNYEVTYKSNCVLYSSSNINWIPPAIYQSSCSIDVEYFPFDQQICEMKFGSWTHKGDALKYSFYLNMDKLDLVDYLKSGSWDIIDCPGKIVTIKDEVTGEEKDQIIFKFVLRRKTLFYTVNLIIPCVLISFVSICVFALPADAGEKITLCISVLLALVVFLLLVSKILPPSLTIPLIAKYLLFTFIMNLIAILSTVVIINRNYRTPRTHQMPNWVRVIFLRELPKYLFMKRPDHDDRWEGKPNTPPPSFPSTPETRRVNISRNNDLLELTEVHHPHCKLNTGGGSSSHNHKETRAGYSGESTMHGYGSQPTGYPNRPPPPVPQDSTDSTQVQMTPELFQTIEAVKFIYNHLKNEEEYENILEDWKYVARVLDRLLLIIFLLVTLSGTAGILLNAPHIIEYVDQDKIIDELLAYIEEAKTRAVAA
ncbi:non-alpha nicotinic acetylcholine receptor subunit precursor [Aplysia californica]|uniref:Non-alpha nicotinic acetylcholine receptor subunit n=1 Tax=Aplysia californica TaxID=6500 RepID=Q8WSF9_APLCA|nr:non-alpha nicotinic acetylcholine receptor subunit precursor [Aplysia californica]AAL37250.1 non-alpha nicotinic acetylcholine receptor subunit [Aplysia californica]